MSSDSDFEESKKVYVNRRQYLVTYSQADLTKFPSRESFSDALVSAFNGSGKVVAEYWACCLEEHENTSGYHYHASVKLSGPKRWDPVKRKLKADHGITVNFSEKHENYYSAYKYVTKKDREIFKSANHPDLDNIGSPVTKKCMTAYRKKCEKRKLTLSQKSNKNKTKQTDTEKTEENSEPPKQTVSKSKKVRRLSNLEVAEYIVKHDIQNEDALLAKAEERRLAGKKDLANYVFSRNPKSLNDLLATTWKMQVAQKKVDRKKTTRMEKIREAAKKDCVPLCNGEWSRCAHEVLQFNGVHPVVFGTALRDLLTYGRGKHRNVFILGPADCGKTFLLEPLQDIFETFSNPANNQYAWLGVETSELIFLNEFRWEPQTIAWKELLLLLEGQLVHLPTPKNHYAKDITIDSDIPIVATSKSEIKFKDSLGATDPVEDEMMAVRWKKFTFHHRIAEADKKTPPKCTACFAKLVLQGEQF